MSGKMATCVSSCSVCRVVELKLRGLDLAAQRERQPSVPRGVTGREHVSEPLAQKILLRRVPIARMKLKKRVEKIGG